jgi:hypothetical protein
MRQILVEQEPWATELLPRVLPVGWQSLGGPFVAYQSDDGVRVIVSGIVEADGKRWWHVSLSRPNRLPTWADVKTVKNLFVGRDRLAIQVLPRQQDYVNYHPHVLHLWCCLDGDPVPDFRHEGMI